MVRWYSALAVGFVVLQISQASAANTGPSDSTVQTEIVRKSLYNVSLGAINALNDRPATATTKLKDGSTLLEWQNGKETLAASYGNAGLKDSPNVWRLTEVDLTENKLSAVTTTYFKNGLRSRTECKGETDATLRCATASLLYCEKFKRNMSIHGAKLGLVTDWGKQVDQGVKDRIKTLGAQCSDYATFLANALDPNKMMEESERKRRDDNIVKTDLAAIDQIRKSAKTQALREASFKGLNDIIGKGDDVGASSSGMRDRLDNAKDFGTELQVLSSLAITCADAKFVAEGAVNGAQGTAAQGAATRR